MLRRLTVPVLLLLAAPACSGEVLVSNQSTAAATGTGSGPPTGGVGGFGSSVGSVGVGGSGGFGVGVGGAPNCKETHDKLSVALSTWQGNTYSCAQGTSDFEFSAAVVDTPAPGLFVLDSCSPGADCIPFISKLSIAAPRDRRRHPEGHLREGPRGD